MIRLWLNRIFGRWVKVDWDDIHDSPTTEEMRLPPTDRSWIKFETIKTFGSGREHG